eukprot:PRCOL_00003278-RA
MVSLSLRFGGGLEALTGGAKVVDDAECGGGGGGGPLTARALLAWVRDNVITERPELFLAGDTVRPGVLVLINDCDWELEGGLDAELADGDVVSFISTLHGG